MKLVLPPLLAALALVVASCSQTSLEDKAKDKQEDPVSRGKEENGKGKDDDPLPKKLDDGKRRPSAKAGPTIGRVSLSPDGKRALSTSGDTLTLWSLPD